MTPTDEEDLRVQGPARKGWRDSGLSRQESKQVSPPAEVDEDLWRELMTPIRNRWDARSRDEALTRQQRRYAARRARRLEGTYAHRAFECERTGVPVRCGCQTRVSWFQCRQHLVCESCQRRRGRKQANRIRHALDDAYRAAAPGTLAVLVTLTVRHTGDIGQDRRDLVAGWRRFYKALHRRIGAFKYIGVHEITPGRDALGHPHAHVVCLWPHLDWSELAAMWRRACPQSTRINFKAARTVRGAAAYVAKYVSKGVNTSDFTPELRARAVAGTYGSRWLFTSARIWLPFSPVCPCCKQPIVRAIVVGRTWLDTDAPASDIGGTPDWWDPPSEYQLAIKEIS